jgi:hypothetical protein
VAQSDHVHKSHLVDIGDIGNGTVAGGTVADGDVAGSDVADAAAVTPVNEFKYWHIGHVHR